jgi:hypothetical protein
MIVDTKGKIGGGVTPVKCESGRGVKLEKVL